MAYTPTPEVRPAGSRAYSYARGPNYRDNITAREALRTMSGTEIDVQFGLQREQQAATKDLQDTRLAQQQSQFNADLGIRQQEIGQRGRQIDLAYDAFGFQKQQYSDQAEARKLAIQRAKLEHDIARKAYDSYQQLFTKLNTMISSGDWTTV